MVRVQGLAEAPDWAPAQAQDSAADMETAPQNNQT